MFERRIATRDESRDRTEAPSHAPRTATSGLVGALPYGAAVQLKGRGKGKDDAEDGGGGVDGGGGGVGGGVGTVKKPKVRKSDTVHWYEWTKEKGFAETPRKLAKGTALKEARPTPDAKFGWFVTADDQAGYLHTSNVDVTTWGPLKTPQHVDKNRLLETTDGSTVGGYTDTQREWYLDQAVLMRAYRKLEGKDPATQKKLAHAMFQSHAKSAAVDRTVVGDPLGIQSTAFQPNKTYHRSSADTPILRLLRHLTAKDMGVPVDTMQVVADPLILEVLAREFPVYRGEKKDEGVRAVDPKIGSVGAFGTAVAALLHNLAAGHTPEGTFVFDCTAFYTSVAATPRELEAKVSRPLEREFLQKATAFLADKGEDDTKKVVETLMENLQLVVLTKQKNVDVLLVPPLFGSTPAEGEARLSEEESALVGRVDKEKRAVFMEAGSHDDRKLDSAMIESGARVDPIAAREAMLDFAGPEQILGQNFLKVTDLATKSKKTPTVCANVAAFVGTATFTKFRALSGERDAPPYQTFYPAATADLLAGLADVDTPEGGIDETFAAKDITEVLQTAYYRMLNAMAGATTDKGDIIKFMNHIELLHDQLQMVLAIGAPHAPQTAFSDGITKALKTAPEGQQPTIPTELTPKVNHKASAMHSIASTLSGVESQKEEEEGSRRLNALVLKDNYYEAAGAVGNSKTYDVSVLDGYSMIGPDGSTKPLQDESFVEGKKPKGPIDIFICDFHHNISVERSEYQVENITHQVDELYAKGLVADKFTVAIDCTVDFIRSDDIRGFLEKHKARITSGKMNVVLYRSAQKFDMLGMDNYYGGYTVTINDGTSWEAFNARIGRKGDDAEGLSHQGMAHLATYGSEHLDAYRKALMDNTKKLYEALPAGCRTNPNASLYIAKTEDPRNVFLDIQFPGRTEGFATGDFYMDFVRWAQTEKLGLTTRPSFGFATTNFTTIMGSKVRLNPGLESGDSIAKYVAYFTRIFQLLTDTDAYAFVDRPRTSYTAEELGAKLDQLGAEALRLGAPPTPPPRREG